MLFPPGTYLMGMVFLRDHVTVELGHGAEISASTEQDDYKVSEQIAKQIKGPNTNCWGMFYHNAVFYADGSDDIGITGQGKILMNYQSFFG